MAWSPNIDTNIIETNTVLILQQIPATFDTFTITTTMPSTLLYAILPHAGSGRQPRLHPKPFPHSALAGLGLAAHGPESQP